MKKYLVSFLKLAVSLSIGVGLVVWFVGQMSEDERQQVINDIVRADYFWVAAGPLLGFVSNYFRAERWRLLLRPLGYRPGFLNTFLSIMIMYFLNLFFPRLGEVSRCGLLSRYEKVPLDKAIGTMVLERVIDVICLALVALLLLATEHDKFILLYEQIATNSKTTFADIIAKNQISPIVKYTVTVVAAVAVIAFIVWQVGKGGIVKMATNMKQKIWGLLQGVLSIKDIDRPFLFLFQTLAIWVCYFLMGYFSFRIFPETAHLGLLTAGVCLFFGGIAFSLTPGGLGLYPIFIQIILGLYGIVGSAAISFGLVVWTAQTASVLLAGVVSLILLAILNREPALQKEPLKA